MQLGQKIGVIGIGVVGKAIAYTYDHVAFQYTEQYDIDHTKCNSSWHDILNCQAVFVCVPSPLGEDGRCDTSILENVLEKLAGYTGVIISKVTAPPDTYAALGQKYPNLVYVPEFLTEEHAVDNYIRTSFLLIGGTIKAYQHEALRIIKLGLVYEFETKFCTLEEASLAKYAINSFLATKVVFMNELEALAKSVGIEFSNVAALVQMDQRFGSSHCQVPGPDGSYGFGGMCFPKDTSALLRFAEGKEIDLSVLAAAVKKNTFLRLK